MDLSELTFEIKLTLTVHFLKKRHFKWHFKCFISLERMFKGHNKMLGGTHVARGQDVAQACTRPFFQNFQTILISKYLSLIEFYLFKNNIKIGSFPLKLNAFPNLQL
jgi:hypothetical protein